MRKLRLKGGYSPCFWSLANQCLKPKKQPKTMQKKGRGLAAKKRPNFKKIRPFLTGFLAKKNPVSLVKQGLQGYLL